MSSQNDGPREPIDFSEAPSNPPDASPDDAAPVPEFSAESADSAENAGTTEGEAAGDHDALDFSDLGPSAAEEAPAAESEAAEPPPAEPEPEAAKEQPAPNPSLWERIGNTSPYSLLLGIALLAIVLGAASLLAEWASYDFDTAAEGVRSLRP
ncbi:MAG: hypothetical protein ACOC46_03570 [Pirellulales bacterium]